jgi:hypothetical protein
LGKFAPWGKPVGGLKEGTPDGGTTPPGTVLGFTLVGICEDLALFCRDGLDSAPAGVGRPQTNIAVERIRATNGYFCITFISHLLLRQQPTGGPSDRPKKTALGPRKKPK